VALWESQTTQHTQAAVGPRFHSLEADTALVCVVVVLALTSHLYYTPHVVAQYQTRVKLNRVFFPR